MQKSLLFFLVFSFWSCSLLAQDDKKEVWYVWIDTEATVDGKTERVVSDEILAITCCVKSPKYRRFTNKTSKWLKEEYNAVAESPLQKIQDKQLAEQMIADAKSEPGVRIVQYNESCK